MSKDKQPKDPAEQGKQIKTAADLIQDEHNYRKHSDTNKARIKKSIDEAGLGRSVVIDADGVLVAGNGVQQVIDKDTPVRVVETDGTELVVVKRTDLHTGDPRRKTLALADNATADDVEWDFDAIAEDWTEDEAGEWGVDWPADDEDTTDERDNTKAKIESVEVLLDEAMRENVRESLAQIDYTMKRGWISSFVTKGFAQAKFLRAKYYGEHYPQWVSLYFCPQRFMTARDESLYNAMKAVANGKSPKGFRTSVADSILFGILKNSYPVALGAKLPTDFPSNTAADLIREFAPANAAILDPCHGWGGRFVGALIADASLYVGCDPSEEAHEGLERTADAFLQYCPDTNAEFLLSPFEDADLGGRFFDFAITSPPYFDVEQYHGENQSHLRYPKYDLWRDGFYRALIEKTYNSLKNGGVFVLQVGSQRYPLLKDGIKIAKNIGFVVEDIRPMGGMTATPLHGNTDEDEENEKIMILKKVNVGS